MANQSIKKGVGVVGSITIDKIVDQGRTFFKLGGVTTYSGITYSRHGIKSYIVANLAGPDGHLLDQLHQENIIVYNGHSDHTSRFNIHIKGDDRFLELPRRARPIESGQIKAVMRKVDGLHLGPLHPLDFEVVVLNFLRNTRLIIFLDVQGYTRKIINEKVYPGVSDKLAEGLRIAQVAKADGAELKAILDFYQMSINELTTKFNIQELVVTLGPKGGFVQQHSGKKFHYDAHKIDSILDSIGAGDVFFAAYIISRFADGKDIPDACRYASQTAAQQVEGKFISKEI